MEQRNRITRKTGTQFESSVEVFTLSREVAIQRIIARAQEQEQRDTPNVTSNLLSGNARHSSRSGLLAMVLRKAMETQGRQIKNLPSIRVRAPDTRGTPFHFACSFVSKSHAASSRAKKATRRKNGRSSGDRERGADRKSVKTKQSGKGADRTTDKENILDRHQRYIERGGALQEGRRIDLRNEDSNAISASVTGLGQKVGNGRGVAETMKKSDHSRGESASPTLMQAYIEDAAKTATITANATTGMTNSFGTIGATPEERAEFWRLTEEAAPKNGRLQNRMTLELPHEASDESRFLIMREFAYEFEEAGVPYWVAIHKPTSGNDTRNYHAHVVYGPRPARKIINPASGNLEWDFSIVDNYISKCGHRRVCRPYKQTKPDWVYDINNVKKRRIRFAEIVNRVMKEEQSSVRYDPRSYEAMGLDVAPMRNVRRVVADKARGAKFVVMDAEWTRRMIAQEIMAVAERRDMAWARIQDSEHEIELAAKGYSRTRRGNKRLPVSVCLSEHDVLSSEKSRLVLAERRRIERDRLSRRVRNEATLRTLTLIIKATDTCRPSGSRKPMMSLDPDISIDDLNLLHAAAQHELELHVVRMKEGDRKEKRQDRFFSARWRDAAESIPFQEDGEKSKPKPDITVFPENSIEENRKRRRERPTDLDPFRNGNLYDHVTPVTPGMQKSMDRMTDEYLSGIGDETGLAHRLLQERLRAKAQKNRLLLEMTLVAREKLRKRDDEERRAYRATQAARQENRQQNNFLPDEKVQDDIDIRSIDSGECISQEQKTPPLSDQTSVIEKKENETNISDVFQSQAEREKQEQIEKKKKTRRNAILRKKRKDRGLGM
ncbi:hypothetical protein GOB93_20520 [Acetobacter musti]|uniref:MobA/MobL protein domain-containing protein n=1 Tax=Acetobacter musti TaxID=864732 RepID=A0ABX0JTW3_9PROT|nr:MobA/MobL family protein [Acetobacter musti]NHN86941.1 hypothetical protein [Acetobacter musti]